MANRPGRNVQPDDLARKAPKSRQQERPPYPPPRQPHAGEDQVTTNRGDKHCHCQGHRLAIVIGPSSDDAIKEAVAWVQSLSSVQHKLFFDTKSIKKQPAFDKPQIIGKDKVVPFAVTTNDAVKEFLDKECKDCCHWDEVALICHGGQKNIWYALLKNLASLLGDRPLRKFVLWMCKSALEFCPKHPIDLEGRKPDGKPDKLKEINLFEQITYLLQPKNCSAAARCGCKHDNCVCLNADGQGVPAHCPDGTEAVKLLCAAWYSVTLQDGDTVISRPAPLGLQQTTQGGYELTSPDGRLRDVTIAPDGSVTTAKPGPSNDVFAGTPLKKNENLGDGDVESTKGSLSAKDRRKATTVEAPSPDPTPKYDGPKRCDDTDGEGCQPDAL